MYKFFILCYLRIFTLWADARNSNYFEVELLVLQRIEVKTKEHLQHQVYAPRPDFGSGRAFFIGDFWPKQAVWSQGEIIQKNLKAHQSVGRILTQTQLKLTQYLDERNQNNVQRFKPLLHVGWHQYVSSRKTAKPWFFETKLPDQSMQIDGLFSVYLFNRYLFIDSNLQFRLPNHQLSPTQPFVSGLSHEPMVYIQAPFQAKRRVLSNHVHGFDHPLGLMLVEIRKL